MPFSKGAGQASLTLIALGLVAGAVNLVYRRQRERSAARRQLGQEIDPFLTQLYAPRKTLPASPL